MILRKNEIEVFITLKGGEILPNDWFGLYNASETNNKNYISYYRLADLNIILREEKTSFKLAAPRQPGDYTIRYFPNLCGYNFVSKSNTIRIINKDKLNIDLLRDPTSDNVRLKSISVSWDIHSVDVSAYDYIGLYKQESLNNNYESFQYVDLKSRYNIFEAPKEVASYHLRYHSASQSKYIDIARSDPIHIQNTDSINTVLHNGTVTVIWDIHSQPHTTWDWLGIFEEGAPNTNYLIFKYIDVNTYSAVFPGIPTGRRYEARYFSSKVGKYVDFRKSPIFST